MLDVTKLKLVEDDIINNRGIFKILDDINIDIDSKVCIKHNGTEVIYSIYVENSDIRSRCKMVMSLIDPTHVRFKLEVDKNFSKDDYESCITYSDYYFFIKDMLSEIRKLHIA